ncbi:acetyltransferase [Xylariaceae sp. FL0255]|nr:acetyltransferase [Xylariaceae sp. FL0255]
MATTNATPTHNVPSTAIFVTDKCYLRPFEPSDAPALAEVCNDREIAKNLRSRFPSPYTLADAEWWIAHCQSLPAPAMQFGIFTLNGELAGSVGLEPPKGDAIYAGTRELGYYLARRLWGRGIMPSAVRQFVKWAFAEIPDMLRIEADVFEHNRSSARVLVKAGFVKEGVKRHVAVKDGQVADEGVYGLTRADLESS